MFLSFKIQRIEDRNSHTTHQRIKPSLVQHKTADRPFFKEVNAKVGLMQWLVIIVPPYLEGRRNKKKKRRGDHHRSGQARTQCNKQLYLARSD